MILAFRILITMLQIQYQGKNNLIVKQPVFLILDLRFSYSVKAIALVHKIHSQITQEITPQLYMKVIMLFII